ncbi:hypothetical protein NCU07180 [Neurospora crassa OR74A]|uniref:Uncharacterized protein n=1 Tax=Neurospora crassa (strain ATCC 24698 / 74-OR23-1A / CBS 708.71 / DSM 1257 / FGSC 987) TaxID=367110 RepID=Q7RZ17_NEUCR|nr:hypothetical protein NCU07180 [Neurospora crassa OR74A]EAA28169.2 hypothetical protein NCU07180 [Neurospora crassa OR74A]|eukprot:XP_957405.2 hypothetical protein NCU07180 [Neurospora crassa OR74A]
MSDQGSSSAIDAESQPQRKRIAVAVSSRDIPLKPDTSSDFGYSVDDARLYANKHTMSPASLHYSQHPGAVGIGGLPGTAEDPLMAQYSRGYAYGHHQAPPPTSHKQYFPATASYASAPNPYGDPTAVGVSGQFGDYTAAGYPPVHAMTHETVGIVPSWGSAARKTPYGGVYMDSTPESYGGYQSSSLVHRPAHHGTHHGHGTPTTESQSPNFSFSGVAASLPTTSTGTDRLLPNPTAGTSRSSLPYPGAAIKTSQPGVSSTLADVAASATAYGGFDGLSASYGSASTASAGHSSSVRSHSTSTDTYHTSVSGASAGAGEPQSIFGEEGRSLQSQGSAFDMNTYTAEPLSSVSSSNRRDSIGSSAAGSGTLANSLSNGQAYVPSESVVQVGGHDHHVGHHGVYEQQRHQALADGHRAASLASHR